MECDRGLLGGVTKTVTYGHTPLTLRTRGTRILVMRFVAIVVILLLSVMTFNAYACLVPFDSSPLSMMGNCPSSHDEQVPQFCDIFKSMSVESTVSVSDGQHFKSVLASDFQGLDQIAGQASQGYTVCYHCNHQSRQHPQDPLLKHSVLRI